MPKPSFRGKTISHPFRLEYHGQRMTKDDAQNPVGDPLEAAKIAALEGEVATLREQLTAAEAARVEAEKFKDVAARAQADLQNAKARLERDREELGVFAVANLLQRLLPVVDNFQRAAGHLPEALKGDEWAKGVLAIEHNLLKILGEIGLQKIESVGQRANPERHEVIAAVPGAADVIVTVLEDGYELQGKVIRVAKVTVGDGSVAA